MKENEKDNYTHLYFDESMTNKNLQSFYRSSMGVKRMALDPETQYPTKTERLKDTNDKSREKALAASHGLLDVSFILEVVSGEMISKGTQSQLIE